MNLGFIGDILFPPACAGCGDRISSGVLCTDCLKNIDIFGTLLCGVCNARLPENKKVCHPSAPYILGAAAPYDDATIRALIHALKFQGVRAAARPLAAILVEYVRRLPFDPRGFTAIPLPLSHERERARRYNQSALIAEYFSEYFKIPLASGILVRHENRKPQSETESIAERRDNIRGCFSLDADRAGSVHETNIILIDDVTTTGATFMEAARILKSAGVKKILALAVARA